MFRGRVFGVTETFSVSFEYGAPYEQRGDAEAPVRLAVPVARVELAWTSDDAEARVVERLIQLHEDCMRQHRLQHVKCDLKLSAEGSARAHVAVQLTVVPANLVLRCILFNRTSSNGAAASSLLAALMQHLDLSGVWKVSGCDGAADFWHAAAPATAWNSLRNLNLSSCGLTSLSPAVGELSLLQILRLTSNKLTTLPPEVGRLQQLEVLAADHNQLTSVPADLRRCTSLKELHLEGNKLVNLLLDLGQLTRLQSLQLFGNPLQYLPELAPASSLRSLSLANVRILADSRYSRWQVEVAAPSSSMVPLIGRGHKLAPLFALVFRRSSISHPLLTGALARLAEDPDNCEQLLKEEVALQQLVAAAMSTHTLVANQAVAVLQAVSGQPGAARKLIRHNAVRALTLLVASEDEAQQLGGLSMLSRLAAGAEERDRGDRLVPTQLLDRLLQLARAGRSSAVRCAVLEALGNSAFDAVNRRRYLQSPGLMQLLVELAGSATPHPADAAAHDTPAAAAAAAGAAAGHGGQQAGTQEQQVQQRGKKQQHKEVTGARAPLPRLSTLQKHAVRLLAILGQNEQVRIALRQPPIRGRGLRILAMDGGGMKGMAMVEMLRQLERRAGRPIWQLFDVIGGTSTGSLLAVALGVLRLSLDDCQDIYTNLGNKVFHQSTVVQEDAGWKDSLYRLYNSSASNMRVAVYGYKHDAGPYETLLKEFCQLEHLGCVSDHMIDTAILGGPKVFAVATLANQRPAAPYVMRNYELPFEAGPLAAQIRACAGSCRHHVWQAVRASSAAPYYLEDFLCGADRFQDGAATANNPALIALQQGRLLYPDLPIELLVSLGCGAEPPGERGKGLSSVMDTGTVLVESACSTERVHEALSTCLPLVAGVKYYRFCPVDPRCAMELDEINPEAWRRLLAAITDYCASAPVSLAFDELCTALTSDTTPPASSSSSSLGGAGDPTAAAAQQRQQQLLKATGAGHWGGSRAGSETGGGVLGGVAGGPRISGIAPVAAAAAASAPAVAVSHLGGPTRHTPHSQQHPSLSAAAAAGSAAAGQGLGGRGAAGLPPTIPDEVVQLPPPSPAAAAAPSAASLAPTAPGQSAAAALPSAASSSGAAAAVPLPVPLSASPPRPAIAAAAAGGGLSYPVVDAKDMLLRELSLTLPQLPPSQEPSPVQQQQLSPQQPPQQQQPAAAAGGPSPHLGYRRRMLLLEASRLFPEQQQQQQQQHAAASFQDVYYSPPSSHSSSSQQLPAGSHIEVVAAQLAQLLDPELLVRIDLNAADWPVAGPPAAAAAAGGAGGAAGQPWGGGAGAGGVGASDPHSPPGHPTAQHHHHHHHHHHQHAHQQQQHHHHQHHHHQHQQHHHQQQLPPPTAAGVEVGSSSPAAAGSTSSWLGMLFPWQYGGAAPSSNPELLGASASAASMPPLASAPTSEPASTSSSPTKGLRGSSSWWGAGSTASPGHTFPPPSAAAGGEAGLRQQSPGADRSPSSTLSPQHLLAAAGDAAEALTSPRHGIKAAAAAAAGMAVAAHAAAGHHEPPRQQQFSRRSANSPAPTWEASPGSPMVPAWPPTAAAAGGPGQDKREPAPVAVLRSALQLAAAAGVGVVHLALHCTAEGLVLRWQNSFTSVVEPGPEVGKLLEELEVPSAANGNSLAELLQPPAGAAAALGRRDGGLVRAVAAQTIHLPGAAAVAAFTEHGGSSSGGSKSGGVTTWLLQQVVPDGGSLLRVQHMYPLLSLLQQLLVVSTGWLPPQLLKALLQGGAHMVVVPMSSGALEGVAPQALGDFFAVFYRCLYDGFSVTQALWEAGMVVPQVGHDRYAAYQL